MTQYFTTVAFDSTICFVGTLCSAQEHKAKATLEGHKGHVFSGAFTADGTLLASGSEDKTVKIWDTKAGMVKLTLK